MTQCFYIEAPRARSNRVANQVPDEILNDPLLNKSIETVMSIFSQFLCKAY
jgi:2-(3-amino-3-carboxypropyl)histidine synthase